MQSKLTQSEGILGLLEAEVDTLRGRLRLLEQEEVREKLASDAERRLKEEQQERIEEDQAAEAEEQAEMEKLLKDLGLTQPHDTHSSLLEATGATTSELSDIPVMYLGTKTTSEMEQPSSNDAYQSEVVAQDSSESNGSDSDDLLSNVIMKKVNGQKTFSLKKESAKQDKDVDPFEFLATENEKEKEKLMKPNELSTKKVPKSNAIFGKTNAVRFAGLSNSPELSDPVVSMKNKDMLSSQAGDFSSSDEVACVSSNGIHGEVEPAGAEQEHLSNMNGSHPHKEPYLISPSPSF